VTRYLLAPLAKRDPQEIKDYIAKDSTTAARRVVRELRAAMESLVEMPGKGHLREDLGDDLRAWVVYSYLIIYRPETRPLQVVRVVSGYRDVPKLFE
jgi:plasmid stabilization system protein ParE